MTPAAKFAEFKRHVLDWQQRLGLLDWRFDFAVDHKPSPHVYARVGYDTDARHALFTLFVKAETAVPLPRRALHEVLHVLVADMLVVAAKRAADGHPDVVLEEHRMIERLLKVLLP